MMVPRLRTPEEYVYLGIQFSRKAFLTLANAGYGKWGFFRPSLDEPLLRQLIAEEAQSQTNATIAPSHHRTIAPSHH
jgi:hypothetical protein